MPPPSALVVLAEFGPRGHIVEFETSLLRAPEARRLGLAMLQDCVERAHLCAGFDPIVAYFPPKWRGDVDEAVGSRNVWAEPMSGPTPGARAESILKHLLHERTYRDAVALFPVFPHAPRELILAASHAVRHPPAFAFGRTAKGQVGMLAVRHEVPKGLARALDAEDPARALEELGKALRQPPTVLELPAALDSEEAFARTHFDMRADLAARNVSGDDVPLRMMELFDAMGLVAELRGDGSVEMRRAGPPRRDDD